MTTYYLDLTTLEKFIVDVLHGSGVALDDAKICGKVLIEADRTGLDSHGIQRLKLIYYDRIKSGQLNAETNFEIVRETPTTCVVDGHNGMGMVISDHCIAIAIEKAKKYGMGMTVCRNSTHFGVCGYYAKKAAKEGLIAMVGTNARPSIAPTWGAESMLGTNPLCFAFPTDEEFPFCIDCATSVTQRGKIEMYGRENKSIPPGWVMDRQGQTRTDTHQVLRDLVAGECSILPLGGSGEETGGYKGYSYATVVEVLSSCLQTGKMMKDLVGVKDGEKVPIQLGHFFMAMDINAFVDPQTFKKQTGDIMRQLRSVQKLPGAQKILTAGEREFLMEQERIKTGVPIPPGLQPEMMKMRDELGLRQYVFEWEGSQL